MFPAVTAITASLAALFQIYLTMQVVRLRGAASVSLGDGGDPALQRAIRGHGNLTEILPLALILLGLLEIGGAPVWLVAILGLTLIVSRILHGAHFLKVDAPLTGRFYGTLLTLIMIVTSALGVMFLGVYSFL